MTTKITQPAIEAERQRETANARADVMRRAEEQGVKPFTSLKDFAGNADVTADIDVDEFLQEVREDRNRHSTQKAE